MGAGGEEEESGEETEYSTVGEDNLDFISGALQWKSDLVTKVTYLLLS